MTQIPRIHGILRRPAAGAAALLALLILLTACPGNTQPATPGSGKVEGEIKAIEMEMARLMMRGDADGYGRHLADDYILINVTGSVVNKAQILEALKAGTTSDSLIPSDLRVRVYGETAVLNGRLIWKGNVNGQELERESAFTKIFVKRKGKWLMVNNQGTPLPPRQVVR